VDPNTLVLASDEREREPGDGEDWQEAHRLDAFFPSIRASVSLMIAKHPARNCASFVAAFLRFSELPIVLVEMEVPLPAKRWEIRSSGLWADHVCESALEHWSYGLEAFALEIDHPAEMLREAKGIRVPLGWELEFESSEPASWLGPMCYVQVGETHGIVLTEDGETPVEGTSLRSHWWGLGGPVELHVGQGHRPVQSRVRLPAMNALWQLDAGHRGLRIRTM